MIEDLAPLYNIDAAWRNHAACENVGEDSWWLPAETEDPQLRAELLAKGKAVCKNCPVRVECLDDDMIFGVEGVRGGLDDAEKQKLERHRVRYHRYFMYDISDALAAMISMSQDVVSKLEAAA